jgi:hypothetical protein
MGEQVLPEMGEGLVPVEEGKRWKLVKESKYGSSTVYKCM